MKRLLIIPAVIAIAILAFANFSQSQVKSYYSGDAVNFNNQLYVASTNSGSLEVFRLENNNLKRLSSLKPFDPRFGRYGEFYDVKLAPEEGSLFVYAISGFTFYKYELVGDRLALIDSQQNTYWEWYNRVDKFNGQVVTISEKGLKFWNTDIMDVVDSLPVANAATPYNIRSYNSSYILDVSNDKLKVYNQENKTFESTIALNYKSSPGNRQTYQDEDLNIYVVDDYYAKKFDLSGRLLSSFRHLDYPGYDLTASGHTDYVYFSNGLGVVKLKKDDMNLVSYRTTTGLGGPRGWAMGLKVAYVGGDKLVIFNNGNILVLDDKLVKLASFEASAQADPVATENLYLNLDHNFGGQGASINLNGGGFLPQEALTIDFANSKTQIVADGRGRFSQNLTVPTLEPSRVDIKVTGAESGLHYSIAFDIK